MFTTIILWSYNSPFVFLTQPTLTLTPLDTRCISLPLLLLCSHPLNWPALLAGHRSSATAPATHLYNPSSSSSSVLTTHRSISPQLGPFPCPLPRLPANDTSRHFSGVHFPFLPPICLFPSPWLIELFGWKGENLNPIELITIILIVIFVNYCAIIVVFEIGNKGFIDLWILNELRWLIDTRVELQIWMIWVKCLIREISRLCWNYDLLAWFW